MLPLRRIIEPWKQAGSLHANINLYGFWDEQTFLTKSGDLGCILRVGGVDYESLDIAEQETTVKRLEAALKCFAPGFHVYQYLFKTNRPNIPFARYSDPLVENAVNQRRAFFEGRRDRLFHIEIYYAIILEGSRSKTGIGSALVRLPSDLAGAVLELKAQFTNDNMKVLLRSQTEADRLRLEQRVQQFVHQIGDIVSIQIMQAEEQFRFLLHLVNFDDWRIAGTPKASEYLDYQVVNSDVEAERDHLRVGDHFIRVLTMKEPVAETGPLVLNQLLKMEANFYVATEWTTLPADKAKKEVRKRRRHANLSKTGFVSSLSDASKTIERDRLVDESKQPDIEELGDCLRALGDGQALGELSLTVVIYGREKAVIDRQVGEFAGVFTNQDGSLFAETYNQLNAFFATVPENYAHNLRKLYLLHSNYADLSFLFTVLPGEQRNPFLR